MSSYVEELKWRGRIQQYNNDSTLNRMAIKDPLYNMWPYILGSTSTY